MRMCVVYVRVCFACGKYLLLYAVNLSRCYVFVKLTSVGVYI